jgi:hypothetical protein
MKHSISQRGNSTAAGDSRIPVARQGDCATTGPGSCPHCSRPSACRRDYRRTHRRMILLCRGFDRRTDRRDIQHRMGSMHRRRRRLGVRRILNTDLMARRLARAMLTAAFLLGYTHMLMAVADVPVAQAKPQHTNLMCSPSPSENCYAVFDSMMSRCAGMPRNARDRCRSAAKEQLADCLKKDGFMGGGGRF